MVDPPSVPPADIDAWWTIARRLPDGIATLAVPPIELPVMDAPQAAAWHTLMDREEQLDEPWVLVGGQMTMLHCLEHGIDAFRPTDDGDVVLGVWTRRQALTRAVQLLQSRDFALTETSDGFAYRYERDGAKLDLLLPEGLERQRRQPTVNGRPGLSVEGGNQALIRAQRLPVRHADRVGHMRRPNILGALVIKSVAVVVDSRDPDRHREDLALLGQVALTVGLRGIRNESNAHDRKRLRNALSAFPAAHPAWRRTPDPQAVRAGLALLAAAA